MKLKIAEDLKLPLDAATQTFAFIARKGAGKTYTAGKLVELFLEAHIQVVVLDTVGNWYGLRLAADGKREGFDVPVIGGLRGDIPLEATGGALVADIVVDTGRSIVIDASQFNLADRRRFAHGFGERLWQRKKGENDPTPVHLVIEESQLIVPQDVRGDVAKMVGIYEEIIRLGRNYGIGVSMITQRPQSVNKEVLNQTECLFVGQVNGAQEREALKKWITHQGMDVHLVDELPSLKVGTFYVWSPQWLDLLQKVQILPKTTYDASATPKVGDKRVQRDLKPLDLTELQAKMADTIERAKAQDPKHLRGRIADLERQLERMSTPAEAADPIPILTEPAREALKSVKAQIEEMQADLEHRASVVLDSVAARIDESLRGWRKDIEDERNRFIRLMGNTLFKQLLDVFQQALTLVPDRPPARKPPMSAAIVAGGTRGWPKVRSLDHAKVRTNSTSAVMVVSGGRAHSFELDAAERRILQGIAWYLPGLENPTREQVAFAAGYAYTGHVKNTLGSLRTRGLIDYPQPGTVSLSDAGRALVSIPAVRPSRKELIEKVRGVIREEAERRIFEAVLMGPGRRETIAERAGYAYTGHVKNVLGALRTKGIVDYPSPGHVDLSTLFDI